MRQTEYFCTPLVIDGLVTQLTMPGWELYQTSASVTVSDGGFCYMYKLSISVFAAMAAVSTAGYGQQLGASLNFSDVYQVGYAANLNIGDAVINISNVGAQSGFWVSGVVGGGSSLGNICANVFTFDATEEEVSCCACLITPNGLDALSVKNDLISN